MPTIAGAADSSGQLRSSCSEACVTAASSGTDICLDSAAPWPSQELEAGDGRAFVPPPPLGVSALFGEQAADDGMGVGPAQCVSPCTFQGRQLGDAVRPGPGAARGPPAWRAAWGSSPELAVRDTPHAPAARGDAPQLAKLRGAPRSKPASPRTSTQRPHSLPDALVLAQQLLDECGRPPSGGVLRQDYERLAAVAAAAAAIVSAASAGGTAADEDLPVRSPFDVQPVFAVVAPFIGANTCYN